MKIIIIIFVIFILFLGIIIGLHFIPLVEKNTKIIDPFFKKIRVNDLTKEEFEKIELNEDETLYYFNEECPDYTNEIFLVEETKYGEKYYIPEKDYLIKLGPHKWTKKPEGLNYWERIK